MSAYPCPVCGGPYDPVAALQVRIAREQEFVSAYPYVVCPECKKRISAQSDSIDASTERPTVAMVCSHCGHRFDLDRVRA